MKYMNAKDILPDLLVKELQATTVWKAIRVAEVTAC